jgi:hypothetical protein
MQGWKVNYHLNWTYLDHYCRNPNLGLGPRQGFAKVRAKSEPMNHISCSQECKRV